MKLTLQLPGTEHFNDDTQTFVSYEPKEVVIEHSLYNIARWEEKHHKAFLGGEERTADEFKDYLIIASDYQLTEKDFGRFSPEISEKISTFFKDPACATVINDNKPDQPNKPQTYGRKRQTATTAELIYWQMIRFGVPFECQHWHINRLLTLIRVCGMKEAEENGAGKNKMPAMSQMKANSSINAARRAAMNSKG